MRAGCWSTPYGSCNSQGPAIKLGLGNPTTLDMPEREDDSLHLVSNKYSAVVSPKLRKCGGRDGRRADSRVTASQAGSGVELPKSQRRNRCLRRPIDSRSQFAGQDVDHAGLGGVHHCLALLEGS